MKKIWRKIFLVTSLVLFISPLVLFHASPALALVDSASCKAYQNQLKIWNQMTDVEKADPNLGVSVKAQLEVVQSQCENQTSTAAGPNGDLNPLGTSNIVDIVGRVIRTLFGFAGSIALLMFIWGGFQFLWSAGDPNKVKKGKEILIYASLGIGIMFTSFLLVDAVITALTSGYITNSGGAASAPKPSTTTTKTKSPGLDWSMPADPPKSVPLPPSQNQYVPPLPGSIGP